jgi:DNA mismatch repair protein MutL
MAKIQVLSSEIIGKIAAGEVVERPASVVKELVENSLDAGSRSVKVEIQGGGRKSIRVTDDGEGMTHEEARLAIQRYTTSKILSLEDLFAIRTFGFRGEALSSIAAVSRMKLTTRKEGQLSGVEIRVEGGILLSSNEMGSPLGTAVEVRDLFFNVPARLKFLKTQGTELSHITEIMAKAALANFETQFQLLHEGKLLSNYPLRDDPAARMVEALGKDVAGKMYFFQFRNQEVSVEGFAGDPGLTRPNGRDIYLFVNRRPVRDRLLFHAILESYRTLIPKDRYPVALLFLRVPPSEVDVNVHPSKWEVKFSDSEMVHRSVVRGIRGMLEETPWVKRASDEKKIELKESPSVYSPGREGSFFLGPWSQSIRIPAPQAEAGVSGPQIAFLGQIHETYLIFASPEGLILIDQHAAHERILLEKLSNEFSQGLISRQPLLLPELLELPPDEAKITEEHLTDLAQMGFELEPSGVRSFWMKSTPEILAGHEPLEVLKEMIKEISCWGRGANLQQSFDPLVKMMACRAAIQANRMVRREEAQRLLEDLQKCSLPSHCPHGRPTLRRITLSDLDRMFGRK